MRTIAVFLTLLARAALAQTAADFFDPGIVQEIHLDVAPADWNTLRANYQADDYYPATFHWTYQGKDMVAAGTGIRSRGHGSRSPVKPNLRVDFNHYPEGKKFLGLGSAILKANNQDVSMVKERTIFNLFDRAGLPNSRETHARVFVNGVYYGVFVLTEEIKSDFLKTWLGESSGDLYEWKPVSDTYHWEWIPTCKPNQVACGTDPNKWQPEPLDPDADTFDLTNTIDMFRQTTLLADADFERTMGTFLDLKLWLLHNALENFVADFDSILGDVFGMNNFFLYRYNKSTSHQLLVWDKDSSYDYYKRDIFQNTNQNVLMRRVLAVPARKTQWLESLYKVAVLAGQAGGWMQWENQHEYDQIRQAVYLDTFKQYFLNGVSTNSSNDMFDAEFAKNVAFLGQRAPWVLPAVAGAGYQPPASLRVTEGSVVNAASFTAGQALVPGSLVSLFGTGLAPRAVVVTTGPLPTVAGGVSVVVNGFFAPLLYVSPTQINFQVPWELGLGDGTSPFTVALYGATSSKGTRPNSPVDATFSNTVIAPVKTYAPGVFLARRADGSAVDGSAPAGAGDVIVAYATGLGPVSIPQPTGVLTPAVLSTTTQVPRVTIAGVQAQVLFSGLTPGTAGVYQINLIVPAGVAGGTAPLVVTIGGEASPVYNLATR